MKTCAFSSPMEVKWWCSCPAALGFAGDLPHGHGGKAAAQRQGMAACIILPVAHHVVNSA